MDKNQKEKDRMYEWACEYQSLGKDLCFTAIDKTCASYYTDCKSNSYLKEYTYATLLELKSELEELWAEDESMMEILRYVLGAAMRNKPSASSAGESEKVLVAKENNTQIKEFIYNF